MRRLLIILLVLICLGTGYQPSWTQGERRPQPGDPPVAALISISAPDANGVVTLTGASGTVFPSAYLAVRNLYTQDTVFVQAGVTGSFTASLFGPGNTPFLIVPSTNAPPQPPNFPGSLPGGPGTIVYGSASNVPPEGEVTAIAIDGALDDWTELVDALLYDDSPGTVYALRNQESLYVGVAIDGTLNSAAHVSVDMRADNDLFTFVVPLAVTETSGEDPQIGTRMRLASPVNSDLGEYPATALLTSNVFEARFPLVIPRRYETLSVTAIRFDGAAEDAIADFVLDEPVAVRPGEVDGVVRSSSSLPEDVVTFTAGGRADLGVWWANGRANTLALEPDDTLQLELDVNLIAEEIPPDYHFTAGLMLQPVANEDGAIADVYSNNGWSNVLTPSGLAIDNLTGTIPLGEVTSQPNQYVYDGNGVRFPLDFEVTLPEDLPSGLYVPVMIASGIEMPSRLPLVLNVGGIEEATLPMALLMNLPSDGSRGILPEDSSAALSNRVRFNSPTYILPPGNYPIEPYLPNILPNRYDLTLPPLVPFLLPNGRMSVQVTRPDNTRNNFSNVVIQQNRLSTPERNEATLFGRQSPVDIYRLTSGNAQLTAYPFDQYGEYRIRLSAEIADIWENRYTGGGEYRVVIAEPLDLTPGVLSGTPFEVGDTLNVGLHLAPAVPASVSIRVRVYPLQGRMIERTYEGQANRFGYFHSDDEPFVFETPGEYVIDYDARYRASDGREWAASLRSAGVIASPDSGLIAHGSRGLAGLNDMSPRPAWYSVDEYLNVLGVRLANVHLNSPYHSGDVAWLGEDASSGLQPVIRIQDVMGEYASQLLEPAPDPEIMRLRREGELPVEMPPNSALMPPDEPSYIYYSAVRPGVTVRQMVIGGDDGGLTFHWDSDDPYNQQIGAGANGDLPGDYMFLFGGAVIRPLNQIASYAALAVVTDDERGARVYPPGRGADGGDDGGPLVTVRDEPVGMFFHPTGIRPGNVLVVGDTLSVAGQVAPTLPANVGVTITSPSGEVRSFKGVASAIGYFYDPEQDFAVDEQGVWTIDIHVSYSGLTSAGQIEEPAPEGGVLGTELDGRFLIYVVPPDAPLLQWNAQLSDITIPAGLPYNFNFQVPDGWNNVRVYRTLTMPGYLLEDGELRLSGRSYSYQYNPTNLWLDFPSVEVDGRTPGIAASDTKTLTITMTGVGENGNPLISTRVFTIMHDRLISLTES